MRVAPRPATGGGPAGPRGSAITRAAESALRVAGAFIVRHPAAGPAGRATAVAVTVELAGTVGASAASRPITHQSSAVRRISMHRRTPTTGNATRAAT